MNKQSLQNIIVAVVGVLILVGLVWGLKSLRDNAAQATTTAEALYAEQADDLSASANWLVNTHQNDDGGYSSFSGGANLAPSDAAGTFDAILALSAAGVDPTTNYSGKSSNPVAFLQSDATNVADFAASGGGAAGKAILALTAAQQNPRDFMGNNLVAALTNQLSPDGHYTVATPFDQSLALLALAAVNETAPANAVQWLKDQQADNGSWNDGFGTDNHADATGIAIMALAASGEPLDGAALTAAKTFLANSQLPTGSWEYGTGYGGSANSTALVVQALSALGEDFYTTGGDWDQDGSTPLSALLAYQSDSGAFQADFGSGPFDDFFTTVQAVPALASTP